MTETQVVQRFNNALQSGAIYLNYQPQFNHSTKRMVGVEALIRWKDEEFGQQYPNDFIPVLEQCGLISQADLFGVETICRYIRECLDQNLSVVPISFNLSRYDFYQNNFAEMIEDIRKKYDVPVKYLRAEITESTAIAGIQLVRSFLDRMHSYGYLIEMDDFGSGYSSLNVLKDLEVDVIKLDMAFLSDDMGGRGGVILNSVVQMAKWLSTPVIAEGVETLEQAEFMKSIGCNYIQGYLYSRAIPGDDLKDMMKTVRLERTVPAMKLIDRLDAKKFWDPTSLETLVFSTYVGAAVIFSYKNGKIEILRVNPQYAKEIGMNLTEKEIIHIDPYRNFDEENQSVFEDAIRKAIESEEEVECETWRTMYSKCCGEDRICVRTHMRLIGAAGKQSILYARARNITAERKARYALQLDEKRFRYAAEQSDSYAWEYEIDTHRMRPCSRCMRDLGLPALLENYPAPVFENGIFPRDYEAMYWDWHRQLEQGVPYLEAVIPLTPDRIPFHVRYTTEFDENGRPLKAYGSATKVVDCPEQHKTEADESAG